MRCPRCGNTDKSYFYLGSKGYYCRKCIKFKRILLNEELYPKEYPIKEESFHYDLKYALTPKQKIISDECASLIDQSDVILHCVCGSGKTEIVLKTISEYLKKKKKVCYAISRREVVIDLYGRFKAIFDKAKVVMVCEGHTSDLYGDLIVCTTHQLYRYPKTFDLLILDEVDAFPFKGDEVLNNIALNAAKGHIIYSTATVDEKIMGFISQRESRTLSLYQRPHLKPLIEPKIIMIPKLIGYWWLLYHLNNSHGQYIIFCETKKQCLYTYYLLRLFFKTTYVYSDLKERDENIKAFKDKKYRLIVATTVLERGITIKDVNVILVINNHYVFDKASIIQMTGRVGRNYYNPFGKAYIITNKISKEIKAACAEISYANKMSLL